MSGFEDCDSRSTSPEPEPATKIPEAGNVVIGAFEDIDSIAMSNDLNVTHILTVLEADYYDWEEFAMYPRLLVNAAGYEEENLLQNFSETKASIENVLVQQGGALVHCATGSFRSPTVVVAWLMYR